MPDEDIEQLKRQQERVGQEFGHARWTDAEKQPDGSYREGVAAPLEPTQIAARKFRIDKGINDGTMMSGTWIDAIMAEFAAAVSKNLQEELAQLRKYFDLRGNDVNNTWRDYCAEKRKLERAESRILELEKEIAALRRELSAEINAPGRTDF